MTARDFNPACGPLDRESCERLMSLQHRIGDALDPFGVSTTILRAQQAWLAHPKELTDAWWTFMADLSRVQSHLMVRATGLAAPDVIDVKPDDARWSDPVWEELPFWDITKEWYLMCTHWLQDALYQTPGLPEAERSRGAFWIRKWLNAIAPTNFFFLNPVAMRKFSESNGESLIRGLNNLIQDMREGDISMTDKRPFQVGSNLATTPGAVVFRNRVLEVIQYTPTTDQVRAVPLVIIAPWINKYYILDLNSKKSLVKHFVDQGFTVFITSWCNPGADMADATFDDYVVDGIDKIIQVARSVTKSDQVNAVGYCLGGTGLAIYMAWLAKRYDKIDDMPVKSWTLFTTLTDFARPGDVEVFINEAGLQAIDRTIDQKGYLDGKEMALTFRMLRSNSLIWHYWVHNYLYGETPPAFDVLFWNVDTTRMPGEMHKYYLREFYLQNKLIQPNALNIAGEKINLRDIQVPLYAVGAEEDHIAPWKQTFSLMGLVSGPKTYTLSTSGHILGIVNPPVNPPKRSYWSGIPKGNESADEWRAKQAKVSGSWWEHWTDWLTPHAGEWVKPPTMGNRTYKKLVDAPGTYVLVK
ncbi:polyhydroxyalkanoate synthase [Chitinivorax tropicus]|uniref:Polyhydroxyalkanoate synthase n=1 Tax=Chitinivorax tropicus TaxID=714531 RepID=A0A840MQ36_9PROT|nr:class I poly(R)-hydroxyalkanoic acid synthase [Chitinivorax tropicus]MBB5017361.1 polyhydroxyalkanoate synthase [Chitinivorax tropicus]